MNTIEQNDRKERQNWTLYNINYWFRRLEANKTPHSIHKDITAKFLFVEMG